jgi:large repetitive protein
VPHDAAVNLSWGPPAQAGAAPVTAYHVAWWSNLSPVEGRTLNATANSTWIANLTNGIEYAFEISASNTLGSGPSSNPVDARPGTVPQAPVLVAATAGNGSISATWEAANSTPGYGILAYVVRISSNGSSQNETTPGNATAWNGTGFLNGASYRVTVRAENAFGAGPESLGRSVLPEAPPSAPRDLTDLWDASTGHLVLSWSAPGYLGGVPIDNYSLAWSSTNGRSATTHLSPRSTQFVLPGLGFGITFKVRLAAVNDAGSGPAATLVATTPAAAGTGASPGGSPLAAPAVVGLLLVGTVIVAALGALLLTRRRRRPSRGSSPA